MYIVVFGKTPTLLLVAPFIVITPIGVICDHILIANWSWNYFLKINNLDYLESFLIAFKRFQHLSFEFLFWFKFLLGI
jgi:hypothetical protein